MRHLIEELQALRAVSEPIDDSSRGSDNPCVECVFVDMRPAVFDSLIREVIAKLEGGNGETM